MCNVVNTIVGSTSDQPIYVLRMFPEITVVSNENKTRYDGEIK